MALVVRSWTLILVVALCHAPQGVALLGDDIPSAVDATTTMPSSASTAPHYFVKITQIDAQTTTEPARVEVALPPRLKKNVEQTHEDVAQELQANATRALIGNEIFREPGPGGVGEQWRIYAAMGRNQPYRFEKHRVPEQFGKIEPPEEYRAYTATCNPDWKQGDRFYHVGKPALVPFIVQRGLPDRTDAGVIVVPGGGGRFLEWEIEGTNVARWLNSYGISAFVLKYTVPCVGDAAAETQRAVNLVRWNADKFGLNRSRIGVIGFETGGQAAMAVYHFDSLKYFLEDTADLPGLETRHGLLPGPNFALIIDPRVGPNALNDIMPNSFPVFVAVAEDDDCLPAENTLKWYQRFLIEGKDSAELHVYPPGQHDNGRCSLKAGPGGKLHLCDWAYRAIDFLDHYVFGKGYTED